jgi:hypothetical protein
MKLGSDVMRFLPAALVLLGLACALVAALMRVSQQKGWTRLWASLMVATAFGVGAVSQILQEHKLWPGVGGAGIGIFLAHVGLRKQRKDPTGETPAAKMI